MGSIRPFSTGQGPVPINDYERFPRLGLPMRFVINYIPKSHPTMAKQAVPAPNKFLRALPQIEAYVPKISATDY